MKYCKISLLIYSGSSSLSNAGRFFFTHPVVGEKAVKPARKSSNQLSTMFLHQKRVSSQAHQSQAHQIRVSSQAHQIRVSSQAHQSQAHQIRVSSQANQSQAHQIRVSSQGSSVNVHVILKCRFVLLGIKTARACHLSILRMNQTRTSDAKTPQNSRFQ